MPVLECLTALAHLRFLFFADCQLGAYATFSGMTPDEVEEYATRDMQVEVVPRVEGHEWDAERYALAIQMANHIRPDFVMVGGDMIDDPARADQIETLLRLTRRLDDDIPIRWAPGNHDISSNFLVPSEHDIEKYREVFGPDYYSFEWGGTKFVVMNTVVIDHPELVPDHLDEQLDWLDRELAANGQPTILMGHHPLFTSAPDEADTYWNLPLERRSRVLGLAHRAGVRLALAGHWHRNSVAHDGDLEMVTSGPIGYPLGDDPSGFRIVDVAEDGSATHRYEPLSL